MTVPRLDVPSTVILVPFLQRLDQLGFLAGFSIQAVSLSVNMVNFVPSMIDGHLRIVLEGVADDGARLVLDLLGRNDGDHEEDRVARHFAFGGGYFELVGCEAMKHILPSASVDV